MKGHSLHTSCLSQIVFYTVFVKKPGCIGSSRHLPGVPCHAISGMIQRSAALSRADPAHLAKFAPAPVSARVMSDIGPQKTGVHCHHLRIAHDRKRVQYSAPPAGLQQRGIRYWLFSWRLLRQRHQHIFFCESGQVLLLRDKNVGFYPFEIFSHQPLGIIIAEDPLLKP